MKTNLTIKEATIIVRHFDVNNMALDVDVPVTSSGWLIFVDTYHKGWKATIFRRVAIE